MSSKQDFVNKACDGKILARKCAKCGKLHLATVYFCTKCSSKQFTDDILEGKGSIVTYTIITVPPTGFEKYTPYAWVVFALDDTDMRVSGFMAGITTPEDLPIGTRVRVAGFDDRGIIVQKQ